MRGIAIVLVGCGRINVEPLDPLPDVPDRWELVQRPQGATGPTLIMNNPMGARHLIIVAAYRKVNSADIMTATDDSDCNQYVSIPGARALCPAFGTELQLFYAIDSCPGARTISVTPKAEVMSVGAWEVSGIRTDEPLGNAARTENGPSRPTALGPGITTSTVGEFVVAVAVVDGVITRTVVGNAFTNDHTTLNDGWAHLTDPMATPGLYHAEWDQDPPGPYCAIAAGFKVGP
jgi:hypothetical protein